MRLLPPTWRRLVAPAEVGLAVVFVTLSIHVAALGVPGRTDMAIEERLSRSRDAISLARRFVEFGSPQFTIVAAIALAILCLVARRPRSALACVAAPAVAGLLTEAVLKPLIDTSPFAYPSGHVTGAASVVTLVVLAVGPTGVIGRRLRPAIRLLLSALAGLALCATALSVVITHKHVPTDAAGGALVGVMVTLAVVFVCEGRPAVREPVPAA